MHILLVVYNYLTHNNRDPFVPGNNCLVMCDTYDKDDKPHPTNYRYSCYEVFQLVLSTVCVLVRAVSIVNCCVVSLS